MVQLIAYSLAALMGIFAVATMLPNEAVTPSLEIDTSAALNSTSETSPVPVEEELTLGTTDSNQVFYQVAKVVDGDTISIIKDGVEESVRMIGVDTPETVHPSKPVQCFGKEASLKTKGWLEGARVRLEMEESQGERDKYGRLLGYVFREDGFFVNLELIKQGYAYEYTYNLPYKYQTEFKAVEDEARRGGHGLWAEGICVETETQKNIVTPPVSNSVVDSSYQCSANIYNCGDFNSHAEAQAVFLGCGGPTNDIHRLDSDGDGDACESLR